MVRCIFRKRRLLKPPCIKSKTGCPEVDLLTEFHCIENVGKNEVAACVKSTAVFCKFVF